MFDIQDLIGKKFRASKHLQQRGIADLIEGIVVDTIILRHGGKAASSKRSIEDVMVGDSTYVDIKTRDVHADFSMPNLISIERLRKLYGNPSNELVYIFVDYALETDDKLVGNSWTFETWAVIKKVEIRHIETISWDNLHIQALGKGQLQLKNAADPIKLYRHDRGDWMVNLTREALNFIDKQQAKLCKYRENWV